MQYSAYQIECMLDKHQHENVPSDRSENLSLSEEGVFEARQHIKPSSNPILKWKSPKEVIELIEDKTDYDPIVDFVQQSRAGRFVDPVYVPENRPPAFSLVNDYSQNDRKDSDENQKIHESEVEEKDFSIIKQKSGSKKFKDKVSLNEGKKEKKLSHSDQNKLPTNEKDIDSNGSAVSQIFTVKSVDELSNLDKSEKQITDLIKSEKKSTSNSAAKLIEKIEEDELDEEFEFDEKGLHAEADAENDVVFGEGQIDSNSICKFVKSFPDSAIKFMFRKNLDGRNLPVEYEEIYVSWEKRGLSRGRLKKYLLKLMNWDNFPDIPVLELVNIIKDRQYFMKEKK